jgi:hypothetical protein
MHSHAGHACLERYHWFWIDLVFKWLFLGSVDFVFPFFPLQLVYLPFAYCLWLLSCQVMGWPVGCLF